MIMILLGIFLVNSLLALMLVDSGANHSFVSQPFSMSFNISLGDLECPLQVFIANEQEVSALSIYQGCVMEIFGVP